MAEPNKDHGGATDTDTDELASSVQSKLNVDVGNDEAQAAATEAEKTEGETAVGAEAKPAAAVFDRWTARDDTQIDYGYFSQRDAASYDFSHGGYYITTAINYTNGAPHIGHAYEAVTSDAFARYARVHGGEGYGAVYFLTGADEHGEKIAKTAAGEGKEPLEICDKYVSGFQCLNQRMLISNDDYVRTTSARHKSTARALWAKCAANDDIYLDTYSGWYNVKEETFVTDSQAQVDDYKDPASGQPLQKVQEASYFFRMSKYHDRLVERIKSHPESILPDFQRNSILGRLEDDRLRDLSISRTTFDWGIPVPKGFEENHVMYVWIDALSNYLTGVDALNLHDFPRPDNLDKMWPANVHIIGKDILWFHTVIWPCILMSAGVELPRTVFAHGFVNDKEGKKMSKSIGNVVNPHDMLDKYPVDSFRWYICKEAPYGGELAFSEESLATMHNADLLKTLGNLVHRATNLCKIYCNGQVPDVPAPPEGPAVAFDKCRTDFMTKMDGYELEGGPNVAIQGYRDVNGWLTDRAPWHMKGDELATNRQIVVRATLEAVYALAHLLVPFIPSGAKEIFDKLNTPPRKLVDLGEDLRNLTPGTKIDVGDVMYAEILSDEELNAAEAAKKKAADYAEAQKRKKEKKQQAISKSKAGQQASPDQPDFTKLEIKVGVIAKAWHHPDADKLFCEEIDVGEEGGPRQITSGLREHYTLDEFSGKKVLVVCNLKAAKIVGFVSNGMVLAAKSEDGSSVELISPPEDAVVGERVFIDGLAGEPFSSAQVKKRKVWDAVVKGLKTGDGGVATWEGKTLKTSAGPCAAASLVGAPIS